MLPLHTDRLTVRMLRAGDAEEFVAYRNDPTVAQYQDWAMPYAVEAGRQLIADQAEMDGPTRGDWVQMAVEVAGQLVGDVAVKVSGDGGTATVGYTLAPAHQGRGYASEALAAVVDALCAGGVHRFEASLYPENVASMLVVEAVGFTFEALVHDAFLVDGKWVDDLRYALLAPDRAAWRERDRSPARDVRFEEITPETARMWGQLVTHWSQRRFVAPVEQSYRDALFPETVNGVRAVPWMRGVLADGERAGFVMLDVAPGSAPPFLWRLLIDRRHQRRGIGEQVIAMLREQLLAEGHTALLVGWNEGPGSPRPFYERLGFVPTGVLYDGETEARLTL